MRVLVGYASVHGSTEQIARRIADVLDRAGLTVDVWPVQQAPDPGGYDAVVLGSALHHQAWLPQADAFVHHHEQALSTRPVWLFSVGMSAALPRWLRGTARAGQDRRLAQDLRDTVRPRGHLLLSGVATPDQFPPWVSAVFRMIGARFGDYRDWASIQAWAQDIARALQTAPPAGPAGD